MMRKSKGQSLLEMIVVIGVTGIALVAVALAATFSVRNARVARERATARNYAAEILEDIRSDRTADPETFFTAGSRTETLDPVGTAPVFSRTVTYTEVITGEKVQVQIHITWEDGGNTFNVIEETTFERYIES